MALPAFRIPEAVELIKLCVKVKEPCLVVGPPGIGKSDVINQVRLGLNYDLILSTPVTSDQTDAKGFPYCYQSSDGSGAVWADFIPYGDLRFAMNATRPTIWFIDDLGQASPAVQAAYMQLLLAREVSGHKISDLVTFVAATNDRKHRAGVLGILEPVKSRFASIFQLKEHVDDFCQFCYTNGVIESIPAYVRFNSKHLLDFNPNGDMEASPSPRTWAKLSKLLKELGNSHPLIRQRIVASAIGEGASIPYCSFEKIHGRLQDVDTIIRYPDTFVPPRAADEMYAIASSIAMRASLDTIDNIVMLTERMPPQYATILMHDARAVCPNIELTEAYGRYSERLAHAHVN